MDTDYLPYHIFRQVFRNNNSPDLHKIFRGPELLVEKTEIYAVVRKEDRLEFYGDLAQCTYQAYAWYLEHVNADAIDEAR